MKKLERVDDFGNWREFLEKLEKFRKTMDLVRRYSTMPKSKSPEYEQWQDGKTYSAEFT